MAKKGFREEGVRLIFELLGRKNAEQFNQLGEQVAKRAEDTSQRVGKAGEEMTRRWNTALGRFADPSGKIAPGTEVLLEELAELKPFGGPPAASIEHQMAALEHAMPSMPGYYGEYAEATEEAFEQADDAATEHEQTIESVGQTALFVYAKVAAAAYAFGRAVQKAWDLAEEAAQRRAMREALVSMGNYFDVQSGKIVADLIEISDQTLSTAQAVSVANQALIAGARPFGESVPRLFEIARASAVATGKDIIWVFDTLVRGIARAEPRLIDNANIYLSVTQAAREMAEAEGVVYDELDRQEKMVYTLNAVLQEGEGLIAAISDEARNAQQPFQRLRAEASNLVNGFTAAVTSGKALPDVLNDIADGLEQLQPRLVEAGAYISALVAVTIDLRDSLYGARLAMAILRQDGDAIIQILSQLNQKGKQAGEGADGAADALNRIADIIDFQPRRTFIDALNESIEEGKQALGEFEDDIGAFKFPTFDIGFDFGDTEAEFGELGQDARRYLDSLYQLEEDTYERRLQAGRDFAEDMTDLERDLADERRDILQDYADEVADINREYRQRLEDVDDEGRERELEARQDYQDDLEDEQRDHAMRLVRIERDYREEILRIEEDFAMEMWDAVGERDATAALRAQRRRDLALRRARRERDREVQEEQEDYAATLDDLRENYDKRRQAAREYRRDELAEIERWHERRLEEAQINRDRDLRDMRQSHEDELKELQRHHAERLDEIEKEYGFEKKLADIEYDERENALDAHLARMEAIRQHYSGTDRETPQMDGGDLGIISTPEIVELEGASFAQYEEDLEAIDEAVAALTDSSRENYEEQVEILEETLEERHSETMVYYEDMEDAQADHHQRQIELLSRYLSDHTRVVTGHRRSEIRAISQWYTSYLRYDQNYYSTALRYYDYHLREMEYALEQYQQVRQVLILTQYWWEIMQARDHYQDVEELYADHLQRLWTIYDEGGIPPAPTPGVPEVVGKYATEKSAAVQHYSSVENLYERHLEKLWAIYEEKGIPGASGNGDVPSSGVTAASRTTQTQYVSQPTQTTQTVDLSGLDLNHAVSVAIRNEMSDIDGQIRNQVTRVMRDVFR